MWKPYRPSLQITVGTRIRFFHFGYETEIVATVAEKNNSGLFSMYTVNPHSKTPVKISGFSVARLTQPGRNLHVFDIRLCPKETTR